jgi:polyphosphate kinase
MRRYAHLGTGNYNSVTARFYTDLSLFTANEEVTEAVQEVFNFLTAYADHAHYDPLLVAPVDCAERTLALITRETEHARAKRPARIIAKMNALLEPQIIEELYAASSAGVKIDLIVRGVCALRPGMAGISENIRVRSVVGRFLEHSRLYWFENGGEPELFIGSADLMERNLDRRVETLCPVCDPAIKRELRDVVLEVYLRDNDRAYELVDRKYRRATRADGQTRVNAQHVLLDWYTSRGSTSEDNAPLIA